MNSSLQEVMEQAQARPFAPWDRMPDEPQLWYERFDVYRQLGPYRTMAWCYRTCQALDPANLTAEHYPSNWSERARQWRWKERAAAWDRHEREMFAEQEADLRFDARLARLQMLNQMLRQTYEALQTADVATLSRKEARTLLPQLRMMLRDLVQMQRLEMGDTALDGDEGSLGEDMEARLKEIVKKVYG